MNNGIIALLGIVILFVTLWVINRIRHKKIEIAKSKRIFGQIVKRRKIDYMEEKLIMEMINIASINYFSNILTNRNVFNKAVDTYVTTKLSQTPEVHVKPILERIKAIRIKSTFHRPISFRSLTTTKEIELNTSVSIEANGKRFKSSVSQNDELYLSIPLPSAAKNLHLSSNKDIFLGFFIKNDGHYRIKMNIAKISSDTPPIVYLKHTLSSSLSPKKREYSRVRVALQTTFELIVKSDSEKKVENEKVKFKGIISNISAGGAEIRSKRNIPTGVFVIFDLSLESDETLKNMKAMVIRKVVKIGYFIYNIKYIGISPKNYKSISRFVNLKIKEKQFNQKKTSS